MRKSMKYTVLATLAAFTMATGCAHDKKADNNQGNPDMLEPEQPTPDMAKPRQDAGEISNPDPNPDPQPEQPKANVGGYYHKIAQLDLSGKGVLPGVGGPILAAVAEINTNPGSALFDAVAAAGIPDVSDALNGLDSTLKSIIKAALDTVLKKLVFDKVPAVQQVADVIGGIAQLFQKIEFHSQVALRNYNLTTQEAEAQEQFYALGFTYLTDHEVFQFPANILPMTKISGGKKLTHIVPVNAPEANFKEALLDGGNLATFPIGDVFVQAAQKMIVKPLSGYDSLADLLNSVIPCDDLQGDLGDAGVTICKTLVAAATEAALAPIKNFKFENVTVDRADVTGYDVNTKQPTVDNLTSRMSGTQPITFQQVFSADVKIKISAPFEAERVETPMFPVTW